MGEKKKEHPVFETKKKRGEGGIVGVRKGERNNHSPRF